MKLKAFIPFANARPKLALLCTGLPVQESDIIICNLLSVPCVRFSALPSRGGGGGTLPYKTTQNVSFFRVLFLSPNSLTGDKN